VVYGASDASNSLTSRVAARKKFDFLDISVYGIKEEAGHFKAGILPQCAENEEGINHARSP
jgi:hypothetical protein